MSHEPEGWAAQRVELDAWKGAPLDDLVQHIVDRYHREARVEMARLETQVEEAALMEGRRHPVLLELRDEVARFCADLRAHLHAEERMLFPALLDLAHGKPPKVDADLLEPLKLLEDEHGAVEGLFKRMRALTDGFIPPADARASQRKLFETLQALSDSLYRHIYLENQVLFARVRAVKA